MFADQALSELWADGGVRCVVVAQGHRVEVELRNADGTAFLRKSAPNRQAAINEAEYLRLLLRARDRVHPSPGLKPFALVIEDDRESCDALAEALRISGMRAFGCRSGSEGIALARELTPDLIVLDYRLPDVNGAEVCRMLRGDPATAGIPIVAVTASPEFLREEACGPDAVLTKPCEIDTLMAAARLFVRHAPAPDVSSW